MSNIKYYTMVVVLMILLPYKSLGQSFKADLAVMYNNYLNATDFYAKVNIKVYEQMKDVNPYLIKKATISKSGDNFLYELDNNEMLLNKKCAIIINDDDKTVIYKTGKRDKENIPNMAIPNFDSLLTTYKKVTYNGIENGNILYTIDLNKNGLKQVEIHFNQNRWLAKVVYYYDELFYEVDSKVVIKFTDVTNKPNFTKGYFSESKYILKKNGIRELHPNYKSYKLIELESDF